MCPDNAAPGNSAGARCVRGGEGEGEGEVVEQQTRALGNPCSSFSSSSSSLCIRRGFDKTSILGLAVQAPTATFLKRVRFSSELFNSFHLRQERKGRERIVFTVDHPVK
jgi:hypothetical protein